MLKCVDKLWPDAKYPSGNGRTCIHKMSFSTLCVHLKAWFRIFHPLNVITGTHSVDVRETS